MQPQILKKTIVFHLDIPAVQITNEEREKLNAKESVSISFLEDMLQACRLHPKLVPDETDLNTFAQNVACYKELRELITTIKN